MAIIVAPAHSFHPGGTVEDRVFGDSDGTIGYSAASQSLVFQIDAKDVIGDADEITGTGRDGHDWLTIHGVGQSATNIFGDAETLTDTAHGGNDHITANGNSIAHGDADTLIGHSVGGNDSINGTAVTDDPAQA